MTNQKKNPSLWRSSLPDVFVVEVKISETGDPMIHLQTGEYGVYKNRWQQIKRDIDSFLKKAEAIE